MRFRIFALTVAAALLLSGCGRGRREPAETVDPYEGMVQVESGFGSKMWVKLYDDVPVSSFDAADFTKSGGFVNYTGSEFDARWGIDVSEHQGVIDWEAVAADGVDFAMIRAGYRGYSQGGLYEDEYFGRNVANARSCGVNIGVYFFSQAVTPEEAVEEAEYLLELMERFGFSGITTTVAFDWEHIGYDEARTDGVDGETLTDCAVAFCERVKQAGHEPVVYAYRNLAYFVYDLPRLGDYALWIAALGDYPDFYYKHEIWQYSAEGYVRGIDGPVDLNLCFEEKGGGAAPAGDGGSGDSGEEKMSSLPASGEVRAEVSKAAAGTYAPAEDVPADIWMEFVVTDAGGGFFEWPCASSSQINSIFGHREHPIFQYDKYHSGVDIGADEGAEVTAAADGIVAEAGFDSSYGNYVVILHSDIAATLYAHMSRLAVSEEESVSRGDTIGYVGSTGNASGPHLHFEVQLDGECVDPLLLFDGVVFTYSTDA